MASELPRSLDTASKFSLFSVSSLKDEKLIKSKPTWKLKHANSILESSEYFCQISSKLIFTILSYTVSKLVRFLRHSVQSKVCKFVLLNWPIVLSDLEVMIVRFRPNDTN